ncbi:MAG: competence/damage-inducible protein A [Myxococcales bacterium]|nr:competence/damage-inducible protein A [Myxococcales bacterium]
MSREKKAKRATEKQSAPTAAMVVIGNEILSGKIADQNLMVLAGVLRDLGVKLERAVIIPDDLRQIAHAVRELAASHTWVFTSGGVGPTHDDVTIAGVAKAFKKKVVSHPEMDALIRATYGDRLRDGHLFMARVPKGARLIRNDEVPWPAVLMRNVWVLPGVPEIFRMKMKLVETEIAPAAPLFSLSVLSTLDEGNLKPLLDKVVADHPTVEIGSYPRWTDPHARTKLTFDGGDRAACEAARAAFVASLPEGGFISEEG